MRTFSEFACGVSPRANRLLVTLAGILLFGGTVLRADAVQYKVSILGPPAGSATVYSYTYFLSGFDFSANEDLDIQFDPSLYGALSNGIAGSDFTLFVFQPNNPSGSQGDYDLLANVDRASLSGKFSVDFTWTGPGTPLDPGAPVAQQFNLDQFNSDGSCDMCPLPGGPFTTTAAQVTPIVPEPGTASLVFSGALVFGAFWFSRRLRRCVTLRQRAPG